MIAKRNQLVLWFCGGIFFTTANIQRKVNINLSTRVIYPWYRSLYYGWYFISFMVTFSVETRRAYISRIIFQFQRLKDLLGWRFQCLKWSTIWIRNVMVGNKYFRFTLFSKYKIHEIGTCHATLRSEVKCRLIQKCLGTGFFIFSYTALSALQASYAAKN